MSRGKVYLIGGGPGAPDLLTLRGARAIAAADVVIWGRRFLMDEAIAEHARPEAERVPWPPATMKEILQVYDRASTEGLVVARLHSGDPTIFGKLDELDEVRGRGLSLELVPGVSAVSAAGAVVGRELTSPDGPRALILTAPAREGNDRPGERISELARHGATMAIYMASSRAEELQRELLEGGYAADTPCAVVQYATWPEELVHRCPLAELAERAAGLETMTIVLVGPAIGAPREPAKQSSAPLR